MSDTGYLAKLFLFKDPDKILHMVNIPRRSISYILGGMSTVKSHAVIQVCTSELTELATASAELFEL